VTGHVHQWQGKRGLRDPSIEVKNDWPMISEMSKNHLEKLNPIQPIKPFRAAECGEIHAYNKEMDRARSSRALVLAPFTGTVYNV